MGLQEENRQLEENDRRYVWHPFTQMSEWEQETPVIIAEGRDCFIRDIYGKWYLDGVSSLWVNIFGHRKEALDNALKNQIDKISHSTMLGMGNVPAIELAEKLITCAGREISGDTASTATDGRQNAVHRPSSQLSRVFYSDNGSTAVEVALKMAFQYWQHLGEKGRTSFLSLDNAYHGDTLGAVSVGGIDIFHKVFEPLLFRTFRAPSPYCYRCELGKQYPDCGLSCAERMAEVLREHHREIAAVIIEPLVQAAGGMIVAPPGYLARVRELCRAHDVLLIADEVATGFGRTGRMFACQHENVVPDIMCLSKGITGGYLPLAATLTTEKIYRAFLGEFRDLKTFFHGHSYTGNPLACATALACLEIFEKEDTLKEMQPKIALLEDWLKEMADLPHVGNVRNRGLMAGIELVIDKKTREAYPWEDKMGWQVAYHARDNGVLIRPLGNVVVIMPPLSISPDNLRQMLKILRDAITLAVS
ncbi:MAG TPA: adenosylmethionine--8-amino-7-oxononanoate transaminase [Thermodesulfovibrionales bacterium]|nr:adenosylmethionine--8-amino-7-oxononanoate transaminase [Thermodesulfovibrionales bacterium]